MRHRLGSRSDARGKRFRTFFVHKSLERVHERSEGCGSPSREATEFGRWRSARATGLWARRGPSYRHSPSGQDQNRGARIGVELRDQREMRTQKANDIAGRAVPHPEKNQLWWRTVHQTALVKVPVLGDDDKTILLSVGPDVSALLRVSPHCFT
jgi:hypothetical protein